MGANNPTQRPTQAMPTASKPFKPSNASTQMKSSKVQHDAPNQLLQHIAEQLAAQTEELQHIRRYAGFVSRVTYAEKLCRTLGSVQPCHSVPLKCHCLEQQHVLH
jgi:hypothetical protein